MKNKKLFAILTLVCFMFTLMPVAAFAADPYVWIEDGDEVVRLENGKADVKLYQENMTGAFYVFAMEGGKVTENIKWGNNVGPFIEAGVQEYNTLTFTEAGEYTIYAVEKDTYETTLVTNGDKDKSNTQIAKELIANSDNTIESHNNVVTVKALSSNPESSYTAAISLDDKAIGRAEKFEFEAALTGVTPNNVFEDSVTVTFKDGADVLKGKEVTIGTNSAAIEVNKTTATTNAAGKITVKVAASIEGEYEIYFTVDGITWTLNVTVGTNGATYIKTVKAPTAPQALYGNNKADFIEFEVTDINGNVVVDSKAGGMKNAVAGDKNYVVVTEAPADSDLESGDLKIVAETVPNSTEKTGVWVLSGATSRMFDAEGDYAVKVILDNGSYATAEWTVKKFATPVSLIIGFSTDVIELGASQQGELLYIDANGVQKYATDAETYATGYAVADVTDGVAPIVTVKDDEKYVGEKFTVTAVSEKYDLVATKEFTVAAGASAIAFVDKAADVDVNNTIEWNVVDENGTRVALKDLNNVQVSYVVLDAPEGAKVSVSNGSTADLDNKGIGYMKLTSNKVGNVTVQVVLKADKDGEQKRYYTGTAIIAVGTQGVGDVVVMAIGSNEIVINDAKGTIDAAPIVENNRTFVPFRALAEAFGATVAYDEATQAVTAELNGVTVVMSNGSAEYTVNGEAATMDVAPFINGSRTMVPVRFAAEAFGIKVIPTYDENGATADILFNL